MAVQQCFAGGYENAKIHNSTKRISVSTFLKGIYGGHRKVPTTGQRLTTCYTGAVVLRETVQYFCLVAGYIEIFSLC